MRISDWSSDVCSSDLPRDAWPNPDKTTRELMAEMDRAIHIPGVANAWTMPIKTRIDMLSTGIKTPIGIKVSGPDLSEQIGRASCRERVCEYVEISVVAVSLKKKTHQYKR